ncbi:amidohydrolase family protein [Alkalibaculum sp. M08DMB]|uniref:Amidohydrolase family protein n=1 Tax=Alkalibaculum sporogenes TaxID=2655001 RepID=A0A6A7K5A2_9FIRM|nr:TatD family hydrolase [Alkalibaculum sporogenes]MPW24437.1 amidohydrolase family protein [Alkalibaculum sporogenes]
MKIIDAHLHFSDIKRFRNCAMSISKVDYDLEGLTNEFKNNKIVCGIGMGLQETEEKSFPDHKQHNPMIINLLDTVPSCLRYCIGINPYTLKDNLVYELHNIEKKLQEDNVVGIKLYPGYYPIPIDNPIYRVIYSLANTYSVPIVIHCGKTYSVKGYLSESHPLIVDRIALKYPNIKFVIAHLGDPWVMDTAAIISNSSNIYSDLSGLIIGSTEVINERGESKLFKDHIKMAIEYANSYDKLLFGSDWPLVPHQTYIKWIKELIPTKHHQAVFYTNAITVFNKIVL